MGYRMKMGSAILALALALLIVPSALAMDLAEAGKALSKAQRSYYSGKTEEANELLKQVEEAVRAAENGSVADRMKAKTMTGRVKKLRKQIDKKLGASAAAPAAPKATAKPASKPASRSSARPASAPPASASSAKMPHGAASRIKDANRFVEMARKNIVPAKEYSSKLGNPNDARTFETHMRNTQRPIDSAKEKIADLEKRYAGKYPPDHPDLVAARNGIADLEKQMAALRAKADGAAAGKAAAGAAVAKNSAEWITRLEPYTVGIGQPGHDPNRYFIAGYTEQGEEMAKRTAIYMQVRADMDAYRKSPAAKAPNDKLAQIAKSLEYDLKTFEESTQNGAREKLNQAVQILDHALMRTARETKKIGTGKLPLPISKMEIERARRAIDIAGHVLPSSDPAMRDAEAKYAALIEGDAKICKARIAETRMIADRFKGKGDGDIRKTAESIVSQKKAGAKLLRTTIVSPDWKEENVVEWTDTTRTALRHRITRYVSAQVAAKVGGDTKIFTVHVARNRQSGGGWTDLYGHIMFEDPILEENVKK